MARLFEWYGAAPRTVIHHVSMRGELLGAEHLSERAREVAAGQRVADTARRRQGRRAPLLAGLDDTRLVLAAAHARLAAAAEVGVDVGPAGEWLLDNNHVVLEHLRQVREGLPPGYYRELPLLASGPLAGYPRVYELATTLISHTEAFVDTEGLGLVVEAFQRVAPLRIGELWALPAMLGLALLESVRRMALRTVDRLDELAEAQRWAARIELAGEGNAATLGAALADFMADPPTLTPEFVSEFLQRLRPARGALPPLVWLENWIAEESISAEEAATRAGQRLAVTQVIMSNSVTSLRTIGRMDWAVFVERQSRLERVLREDPSGFHARMTFETRDAYRHVVERLAKRTGLDEEVVARRAVDLSHTGQSHAGDAGYDPRVAHVGYYLVDSGLASLERAIGFRRTARESGRRWALRQPNLVLFGGIALASAAALGLVLALAGPDARTAWLAVVAFALMPAVDVAVSVLNRLMAALLPPDKLPKLDFRGADGVPAEYRTAVVIPTLFESVDAVQEALENLEAQFLANREAHLHFAVLSDFTDAATETRPDDAPIIAAATAGVRALNARYGADGEDAFHLFHRPRRWNAREGVWMGWERKRGKLGDFNRLIRGGGRDAFSVIVGDLEPLLGVRYVITLDADTVLPPDAAPLLIGAMAHPLNRPVYDESRRCVVRGYGILQPRVGVSLPSAHQSRFAAIFSGHPGVDPYTTAFSDVYQDLYREGSFTGKGIYDVDVFERATHGRFPENTLLSHDLIEGSYARAGLASDITVYDDYPSRYLTHARRKHRWIRGDWQLLGWLGPRVPGPSGPEWNRLSLLSRWKIFDNLRRSIVEPAQLALLVAGWTVLPGSVARWTLIALGALAAPWIVVLIIAVLHPPPGRSWRAYYGAVARDAATSAQQVGLAIVFLVHQAVTSVDAVARTLWRLFVTRRDLLAWRTASLMERTHAPAGADTWRHMAPAVALVAALILLVAAVAMSGGSPGVASGSDAYRLQLAIAAGPLLALWLVAPAIANWLSAPALRPRQRLSHGRHLEATCYALLHWRYFDRFVGPRTNWLAPDNFQERPAAVLAMRTSPTNIGLQLLATVSAYDLGFVTREDMVQRLEAAFSTLGRLHRFRGHFHNWYDLEDLRVLEPAYISTVDSGNLAGHLLAVRQACMAIAGEPAVDAHLWPGLDAGLALADQRLDALLADAPERRPLTPAARQAVVRARSHLDAARAGVEKRDNAASLDGVAVALDLALEALSAAHLPAASADAASEWISWSQRRAAAHETDVEVALSARLEQLAGQAYAYALEMDFGFLFDPARKLFSIGYDASTHALDRSYYDLLASESRLASFLAIAKNDVPVEHWFRLGRTLTHAAGATALVSWSGSMFEYLMPTLVMRTFPATLLDQTYRGAVRRQIAWGAARDVPWGVSESAYNLRDREHTYQYRAFGVPDLGLQRGLGHDVVVAPYASALALMVDPVAALENLAVLAHAGALGRFGFRDAIDYTRPAPDRDYAVIDSYMAHHVGMSLVALTNLLAEDVWQVRFHADPLVRAAELLLYERIPRRLVFQQARAGRLDDGWPDPALDRPAVREFTEVNTPRPHIALLGYRPYTVMVSHCGSGSSSYQGGLTVTRWTRDGTTDGTGQFCYVKDVTAGRLWSAAHQPVCARADQYRAHLASDHVSFLRTDGAIETRTEIAVVPEDGAEIRRVTVTNNSDEPRDFELTSYGEIVMGDRDNDAAHPAFSKLFVETEWHAWCNAVTATRRPRSDDESRVWCVHVVATGEKRIGPVTCETDRARFLGRGRTPRDPIALEADGALSGSTGAVLDPIFSLRTRVRLAPGQSATAAFTTLVATSRERAFELADRYRHLHAAGRALDLAWTSTQVELGQLKVSSADAAVFQDLAGYMLYPGRTMRAPPAELERNRGSQPLLWQAGISGDLPILLASIESTDGLATLRQLFAAHHFWRRHGLKIDLVVLNAHAASYFQELNDAILAALSAASGSGVTDVPGGVYVRRRDLLVAETLLMLEVTAAVHVACDGSDLARFVEAADAQTDSTVAAAADATAAANVRDNAVTGFASSSVVHAQHLAPETLTHDNGYGGLTKDGDYVVRVRGDALPPSPWSNVIANEQGGFVVTERGGGFTWAANSYAFRLTPWRNDPVSDVPGEAVYLRDEESGEVWCPTPAPVRSDVAYRVCHGPGRTSFQHVRDGIATMLTLGMAEHEPVKLSVLRLTNRSDRRRRITMTAYAEWTLGVLRKRTRHHVRTSVDTERAAIFARNGFDAQYADWVAFLALSEPLTGHTADRREFLGRNGSLSDPVGLQRRLSGTTGAALDPCAALRCVLELEPGEQRDIVMVLGAAPDELRARKAVDTYRDASRASSAIAASIASWQNRLSAITVHTPDPLFDVMVNRWALYQTLSCRIRGRAALYQNSGAYGFRDQLQDVMALVHAEPAIAREHILRAAARQFMEGDVQHWWHPDTGRGVRTRFSDDLVWLPFVVEHYVRTTGDNAVLDEPVPFLRMRSLAPDEHEAYDLPQVTAETSPVYEHCVRALRRACTTGEHGLPLIGTGDWNDGMNRVGAGGRGESVWLGWFLVAALRAFATVAGSRDDRAFAAWCHTTARAYTAAIEANGWDGEWYRRAYFDDGTPLGSAGNSECRIDAIAQSWSVLSGAGDAARQQMAMRALERELVLEQERMILLLNPPFDRANPDPGYIRGYLPGVRENGAQYTHAALWAVQATAWLGQGDRAFELLQMLNPLQHARTREEVDRYRVEPYVIAADVYTSPAHIGRGGWTWYTGSASWFYRIAVEDILGFTRRGERLWFEPRVPIAWPEFTLAYRFGSTLYSIRVQNPGRVEQDAVRLHLDGRMLDDPFITLVDDGATHEVLIAPGPGVRTTRSSQLI